MQALAGLLDADMYMPHGYCYMWNWPLVWTHVISDSLVGLSYTAIPATLVYFVRKRRGLPFHWMFLLFGLFIISCGATHYMEVWNLWHADYWLAGIVKAVTALASVGTAALLIPLVPKALALPHPDDLRAANMALEKQAAELREKAELLEEANKELDAFTYSVSHDLRAPLRHVDGFSRLLLEEHGEQLSPEGKRMLERVRQGSQYMGELVDDLLNLSRVTRRDISPVVTDLNSLLEEVITELKPACPDRQVEFRTGRLPFAPCDAGMIRQVFANLLSNAMKFTRPRERAVIEVGQTQKDGRDVVYVRDNGVGFSMKYADKLFGVFQRLHRAEDFEGTGVGLVTVQRIIQKHGGRVWAEAEIDKGATFYFTLEGPEDAQSGDTGMTKEIKTTKD